MDVEAWGALATGMTVVGGAITGVVGYLRRRSDKQFKLVEGLVTEQQRSAERDRQALEKTQAEVKDCLEKHRQAREGESSAVERLDKQTRLTAMLTSHVVELRRAAGAREDTGEYLLVDLQRQIARESVPPKREANVAVLIVDDDEQSRRVYQRMLDVEGFSTLAVGSVSDALQVLATRLVQVVLADVLMPGRSGIDLLHSIRRGYPDLPVVLMSGDARLGVAVAAAEHVHFLSKPFESLELVATLIKATARISPVPPYEGDDR